MRIFWPLYAIATLLLMVGIGLGASENGSVGAGLFFAGAVLAGALWAGREIRKAEREGRDG